tara:strand:- start:2211 stop:5234 length:3024 start_codon:yes stop_codon:yes gene_type:complete
MSIRNPCDEEEVIIDLRLPNRREPPEEPEIDSIFDGEVVQFPTPEEPFPVPILPPFQNPPGVPIPPRPPGFNFNEIPYRTATRRVITLQGSNVFTTEQFNTDFQAALIGPGVNHSSLWTPLQHPNVQNADRFRLAMLNFWKSPYENLPTRIDKGLIGNPRHNINNVDVDLLHQRFGQLIEFDSVLNVQDPARSYRVAATERVRDFEYLEILPMYMFDSDWHGRHNSGQGIASDGLVNGVPNMKITDYHDIYLFGNRSAAWNTFQDNAEEFWESERPQAAEIYRDGNLNFDTVFHDFAFESPAAFFESEMDNMLISPSDTADIETRVSNQDFFKEATNELDVPNIYHYYQSKKTNKMVAQNSLRVEDLPDGLVEFNEGLIQAFEGLTLEEREAAGLEPEELAAVRTSPVLKFTSDRVEQLKDINKIIFDEYPVSNFVKIKINTKQAGPLCSFISQNRMDLVVLEYITSELDPEVDDAPVFPELTFTKILDDKFIANELVGDGQRPNLDHTHNDKVVNGLVQKVYHLFDRNAPEYFLNKFDTTPEGLFINNVLLDTYPLYYTFWENPELLVFETLISSRIFLSQLDTHIADNRLQRSYADILYGRKAYSEVVGYKVEKFVVEKVDDAIVADAEVERLVQTLYFMDSDKINDFEYVDTQIIPDRKYNYKISTINIVLGNSYEYSENDSKFYWRDATNRPRAVPDDVPYDRAFARFDIGVKTRRNVALIEAPFFEKVISVKDRPPVTPQVTFLPYQGIDDTYSILVQANYGQEIEEPIHIFESEKDIIGQMIESQNAREGQKLHYVSDSLPTHFELIRIDFEPDSYESFDSYTATRIKLETLGKTSMFTVDVEPNKYYYYTFRAHDASGFSNPTEIFKVRMVSYINGIFMEAEPFEIFTKDTPHIISFSDIIKISPADQQSMINFDSVLETQEEPQGAMDQLRKNLNLLTPDLNYNFQKSAPALGDIGLAPRFSNEEKVWKKRFKFRIRSKTSGKAIDFNVKFEDRAEEKK